jgi:diguanylate cyclase (GGDEF)-like protein
MTAPTPSVSDDDSYKTAFASRAVRVALPASLFSGTWDLLHGRHLPALFEIVYFLVCLGVLLWRPTPALGRARRWLIGSGLAALAIVYGANDPRSVNHLLWLPLFPLALVLGTVWREARVFIGAIAIAHVAIYVGWRLSQDAWPIASGALVEVTVVYVLTIVLVGRFESMLAKHLQALASLAETDPLTGIANRRRFFRRAEYEAKRARRHGDVWSVLWVDLDHFKSINDRFGHEQGDVVLRTVAARLCKDLREVDLVARVGGEEFAILLPSTDLEGATLVAHRLRASVESEQIPNGPQVTCSLGVAEASQNEELAGVFRRADAALYQAKSGGRNCVVASSASGN